ncbi:cyclic peptide export ABC transporter [Metabacillus idriensis]|uniref:Cyclic peptide export ABC transporter n=1 Tax=Metabacillus idriensis TaxID=324768 RepID=A0A6I2MG82_9BACI|nr:cyclic peptide export ABC transporter [Metabacillus idriensis]MCM3598084.1 cyclic peptide export ABC transporter [Metabacillus idriensis]MRX56167.1 cyclic peptide export ABC transporter [Metabacillus idriensis]
MRFLKKCGKLAVLTIIILSAILSPLNTSAATQTSDQKIKRIEEFIQKNMKKGNIPGMTVVIVEGDKTVYSKSFGYADKKNKVPVTSETSFEIASTSKAFTGLALLKLQQDGLLELDDPVSKFFPGFNAKYKGSNFEISLRQLLHHTSGLPWYTITNIPISQEPNALEEVVRNVNGVELNKRPGERFEYATINYAIVGAVIQEVTGQLFEDYMEKNIFKPLGLNNTTLYPSEVEKTLAVGYKNGFFQAREYQAPVFRGNLPAGYIIMDGNDLAKWLKYQLGSFQSPLSPLIMQTHVPDRTVPPSKFDFSSYAMGWADYQIGTGEVSKSGLNPNYSAYMVFRKKDQLAVGVLANNGTTLTYITGHGILDILYENTPTSPYEPDQSTDSAWSIIALFAIGYACAVLFAIFISLIDIIRKKRIWEPLNLKKTLHGLILFICLVPFVYGLYIIPEAMQGVSWTTAIVWSPYSFLIAAISVSLAIVLSSIYFLLSTLFPATNSNKNSIPLLVMMSLLSGIANAVVIFIINFSIGSEIPVRYLLYYFGLALAIYIFGRRLIEGKLVKITYNIIYQKRMELIDRILKSSFHKLERIDNGRIFATLNNDTELIGYSANVVVGFVTSLLTVICCFVYLGTISMWGTLLSIAVIAVIAALYSIVSSSANRYWEEARDTQNVYLKLIDEMLKGYKQLSMHGKKKAEFSEDVRVSSKQYRDKRIISRIKFTNSLIVGETLLILILGVVTFLFPTVFPDIKDFTLIKFIIVFLYLIGPINGLLQAVPEIMQIKISWKRINEFVKEVPMENEKEPIKNNLSEVDLFVEEIGFHNLTFEFNDVEKNFVIEPTSFVARKGEIIFITGGNGSGKTTLAKLMTGLYPPEEGYLTINGKSVDSSAVGEYYSTVFSDFHLFDKLYEINSAEKQEEINRYLKLLHLEEKVTINDGSFSTVNLSTGQRKRLALLICYLEDRPIYLFDEWAADQDPEFRKIFYQTLLPEMKEKGKIVFAITHDDNYFHVADRMLKMEMGKLKEIVPEVSY